MIWLILGIMALSALLYICAPLFSQRGISSQSDSELATYRARLDEIETRLADGAGNAAELAGIKAELQRQLLKRGEDDASTGGRASKWALPSLVLAFGMSATALYYSLGRPELTRAGSLQKMEPQRGPSAAEMQAAEAMTPEERAAMIQSMVDGLSERLKETPDNPEGWVRLLSARKVLGQDENAEAEILRLREQYADDPELVAKILSASGWDNPQ